MHRLQVAWSYARVLLAVDGLKLGELTGPRLRRLVTDAIGPDKGADTIETVLAAYIRCGVPAANGDKRGVARSQRRVELLRLR